jgi:hypothetical protein
MKHAVRSLLLPGVLLCVPACSSEEDPDMEQMTVEAGALRDAAVLDTGTGALSDAGTVPPSSGDASVVARDAASDAAPAVMDSGPRDAGVGSDASSVDAGGRDAGSDAAPSDAGSTLPRFSFFVTSLNAMRTLSKNPNGFGGDLRFGETGEGAGLRGADKICAAAAEIGMPGASAKQWRAFLSTRTVNARTRIGEGPWYDRMGRLVAQNLTALLKERPEGAHQMIINDLPNELGMPNRAGSAENGNDDNHDTITGTNTMGNWDGNETCSDWTSITAAVTGTGGGMGGNGPRVGHSWPANSGRNWMQAHRAPGCAPSVSLVQTGAGSGTGIGNGGGYGGFYCFALTP